MTKANELMIGAWVLFGTRPVMIDGIAEGGSSVHLSGDRWVSLSYVSPIPITPAILEKNGFRELVTYGTEKWLYGDIRMNIYSSNGCWRFCADTKRNENSVIYIHFIHELQSALRLCRIDKEIEL